ncbi:ABC transporter ATP-binding protein [Bacillus haimaensis]|uniref:ABC transporter ATP-binding protein n=1 Tax=Bacillus haimaensis TaxID=3160967 RepID=UPI003AA87F1A
MIKVKNLSYRFKGKEVNTIKDITFEVQEGEIFGFLGPSGAGKSTTQKILIGLLGDYEGSVRVMGTEVKERNRDFYERIGVAFEFPNFYHKLSGYENLELFKGLYTVPTIPVMELLKLVGLESDAKHRFHSYSKGMKMRLNFCRALLNDPDILFLDEPTSGLDPVNAKKLKDIILEKKKEGKTIILTSHNMQLAEELCDRVAFIVDGKIALIDSPKRLKESGGEKRIIVESKEGTIQNFPLENAGENKEFMAMVNTNSIASISTKVKSLEEIFIEVTGRSLI